MCSINNNNNKITIKLLIKINNKIIKKIYIYYFLYMSHIILVNNNFLNNK